MLGVRYDPHVGRGRLLWTDFNSDLCACVVEISHGFFDEGDIPAWETWFWHRETGHQAGLVYSWVPPALVEIVEEGVRSMPVESSGWMGSLDELLL